MLSNTQAVRGARWSSTGKLTTVSMSSLRNIAPIFKGSVREKRIRPRPEKKTFARRKPETSKQKKKSGANQLADLTRYELTAANTSLKPGGVCRDGADDD